MNKPINHHYVPKCYLNKFADGSGDVYRLNTDDYLSMRKVSSTAICYEPHFYSINNDLKGKFKDIAIHDEMKAESEILAASETKYPDWFNKIIENKQLSNKECREFSQFIISLKTRTRFWRHNILGKTVTGNIDRIAQKLIAESANHSIFQKYPSELLNTALEKSILVYKSDPDSLKYLQLHRILDSKEGSKASKVISALIKSKWTLVVNKTELPFVTTDNPGVSINIKTGALMSVGFNNDFVFMLPLSPMYLLKIDCFQSDSSINKKIITTDEIKKEIVHSINLQLIHLSDNLIISNNRSCIEKYKDIIAQHRLRNG